MQEFDFEEWRKLAETDSEAFELRREQELETLITSAPRNRQQRLRGLKWRVDMERSRHKDPQVSCLKMFDMMWQSVYGDHGMLAAMNGLSDDDKQSPTTVSPPRSQAQVLAFQALSD